MPGVMTLDARPDAVLMASAGAAWTSAGVSGMLFSVAGGDVGASVGVAVGVSAWAGASAGVLDALEASVPEVGSDLLQLPRARAATMGRAVRSDF